MARTIKNPKLDTRSARAKLPERRDPYWQVISAGCTIGYRRGAKGGTWIARMRSADGFQHFNALGAADDVRDSDGLTVFSFDQAQEKAREFFASKARELAGQDEKAGPYSVEDALNDYFAERERRKSKGAAKDHSVAKARIVPALGQIEIAKLTTKRIRDWHSAVAAAPKLVRSKKFAAARASKKLNSKDPEAVRARQSTANRQLTILKAALNWSFHEGKVENNLQWKKCKPFREVDSAVVHFLTADERQRLVNACPDDFRKIVTGALVTGARYGELVRMTARDFNAEAGIVAALLTKSGKPRHIVLNDEGRQLFTRLTEGRAPMDLIFRRADGKPWGPSHQRRPIADASKNARIDPPATFHILRHTYASALAAQGVPMGVIAVQLGHSDTRVTEKHYAHLAPSYVADTIRAALPNMGSGEAASPANKLVR